MAAVSPTTTARIAGDRSDVERATVFAGGAAKFGFAFRVAVASPLTRASADAGRPAAECIDRAERPGRPVPPG